MRDKITLLNKEVYKKEDILKQMDNNSFYYDYLGSKALSSSIIGELLKSPKAYLKSLVNAETTPAMQFGKLFHLMSLEKEKVKDLIIIDSTKAAKVYKDAVAQYGEDLVYTSSEYNQCEILTLSLQKCKEAVTLLESGSYEVPEIKMFNGIPIRGKADILTFDSIIDLKTTSDIANFKYSAKKYNYDLQAVIYMELFDVSDFKFLVVDKATADIGIFECSGDFIDSGYNKLHKGIEIYKEFFINGKDIDNYVIRETL